MKVKKNAALGIVIGIFAVLLISFAQDLLVGKAKYLVSGLAGGLGGLSIVFFRGTPKS